MTNQKGKGKGKGKGKSKSKSKSKGNGNRRRRGGILGRENAQAFGPAHFEISEGYFLAGVVWAGADLAVPERTERSALECESAM